MRGLDAETLHTFLERYPEHAVFAQVEDDRLETLPGAFRDGSYLWKDVEWVVRWYCRRPLRPHDRTAEDAFRENSMDHIRDTIARSLAADGTDARVDALTDLEGVDVPVASAFLQYMEPESFVAIDQQAWMALVDTGALGAPYPDPVETDAFQRFLRECHGLAAQADLRVVDVGRALFVMSIEQVAEDGPGRHG